MGLQTEGEKPQADRGVTGGAVGTEGDKESDGWLKGGQVIKGTEKVKTRSDVKGSPLGHRER